MLDVSRGIMEVSTAKFFDVSRMVSSKQNVRNFGLMYLASIKRYREKPRKSLIEVTYVERCRDCY